MTELYTLSLFFRSGQKVDLFFQSKDKTYAAFDEGRRVVGLIKIDDDYGTKLCVPSDALGGVMIQDCGRASEVSIEVSLLQARNQVRAQERARHDPMINKTQVQAPIMMPTGFNGRG